MEQEVPVTIHSGKPKEPVQEPQHELHIPKSLPELSETFAEVMSRLKASDALAMVHKATDEVKEYIKKNPAQAMLVSLGAGALVGLLLRKKH